MKFKSDFVTNSSSTSYVVYIPRNFNVSPQVIRDFIKKEYDEDFFTSASMIKQNAMIDAVLRSIEDIKDGNCVYEADGFDPEDSLAFNFISDICHKNGFNLTEQDTNGGDGMSIIIGISFDKIQKIEEKFQQR
jgi:ATP-dependent RNA circularization protein (DNA/RNA ligase family)